jgi:hypothetical protein
MAYTGSKYIEDDYISIARGHVKDASHIHKFGAVPAMSQNQTGTVWDVNDTIYPWSAFDTAGVLTVPAVNASDNGKTIQVFGLDDNYDLVNETFTISSTGTTTGTKTFKRVYRAYVSDGVTNVGNINVQRGGTTVLRITAGKGQTLMSVYTVPRGFTGYLIKGTMSCQSGADATGDMFVRYPGQTSFRAGHSFEVSGTGGQYTYEFRIPIQIPAKADIDVRAQVRSNNARITAAFDLILFRGTR